QVAVAVDHAGDDRRPADVDDLEPIRCPRILLRVRRADPGDPVAVHEDAHADPERVAAAVGEGRVPVEDAARRGAISHDRASLAPARIGPMIVPPLIAALPRFALLDGPSPLYRANRLSAALGGGADIWIKREDLLPLAFGGNK